MKTTGPLSLACGLAATILLAGCSGGGSGGGGGNDGGGAMFIQTCSLGCSNGNGAAQVSCSVIQVAVNAEIAVVFSEPVDPSSVSSTTFHLIDVNSGEVPVGTRLVDQNDHRKVIFRPSITFDDNGTPTFGFRPLRTYRITIAGTEHNDPGPFIRSTGGRSNSSRMQCDIQTTNTIADPIPGPPSVQMFVDLAVPGMPTESVPDQPAAGAVGVWRDSDILFVFNDIMNPVTLANPVTLQSTLITVQVDTDGNLSTPLDRATLFGTYIFTIDLVQLKTIMTFRPANGMPSAGSLPENTPPAGNPRKVVVFIPPGVQDLAGNPIANPGAISFTPEVVPYPAIVLPPGGETFMTTANRDARNSGAAWGSGKLTNGWGGGSGRLGSLRVATLDTVVLDTDGTMFKHLSADDPDTTLPLVETSGFLDNSEPSIEPAEIPPRYFAISRADWPTVTVENGIFEFSSFSVDIGGTLRITGSKPARIYSRGPVSIDGNIDIAGETPASHPSDEPQGEPGGLGGPNAGDGGAGGDRIDNTGHVDILTLDTGQGFEPGIENPGAIIDGRSGRGVGGVGITAAGRGGVHFPRTLPTSTENLNRGDLLYSDVPFEECRVRQVASPGGGGAYGTDGTRGVPMTEFPFAINPNPPPNGLRNLPTTTASGGDSAILGIEPPDPQLGHVVRKLDPLVGNLRGGSGGGGGGTHLYDTFQQDVSSIPDFGGCYSDDTFLTGITHYRDHSAGGGGGGGGALLVASGETLRLFGEIRAAGGDGGSNQWVLGIDRPGRAAPGGGGSGGAVKLQAKLLNIGLGLPGRIDVSGGVGGTSVSPAWDGALTSLGLGGDGGSGLVRLEDISAGTSPPATLMTRCSEAPKILPFDPAQTDPNTVTGPCIGLPESEAVLSVGPWGQPRNRPEAYSGATSCWMRPSGDYFTLVFPEDDTTDPQNPDLSWNMQVLYGDPGTTPVLINYRGPDPNSPFGSGDFETNLGNRMNYLDPADPPGNTYGTGPFDPSAAGSYLAVRFQGALAVADISADPCNVTLDGLGSKIAPGSLTPWVRHPAELNQFLPKPNMIRFCIVFDRSVVHPFTTESRVQGVTNLVIEAQPD